MARAQPSEASKHKIFHYIFERLTIRRTGIKFGIEARPYLRRNRIDYNQREGETRHSISTR